MGDDIHKVFTIIVYVISIPSLLFFGIRVYLCHKDILSKKKCRMDIQDCSEDRNLLNMDIEKKLSDWRSLD